MELGDICRSGSKNGMESYAQNHTVAMDWNSALSDSEQAAAPWINGRRFFFILYNNRKVIRQLKPDTTVNTYKKTKVFQIKIAG